MERELINRYLQHAPLSHLTLLREQIERNASVVPIQKATSQTLLLPVRDPINKGSFFSGEVLVTSSVVQVNGFNGWAMVMDDNPELADTIARLDAAYAAGVCQTEIEELVLLGKKILGAEKAENNAMVNTTRVSFDLL